MPIDPDEPDQTLADAAAAPLKSSGDDGSIQEHSLPDLIAYDRYKLSKARTGLGIRITKLRPGGTVGDS